MSNIEHLIENAISATKEGGSEGFQKAMKQDHNKRMLNYEKDNISVETLWTITQYIVYSHDENLIEKYTKLMYDYMGLEPTDELKEELNKI